MRQEEATAAANLFRMDEWPNKYLREAVIRKLEDELARNPHFVLGTSHQVEDFIFQKSKNQDDYRRRIQKFIDVINGTASRQPSYQQSMGAAAAAAASSAAASTTSQHTGQPLGNGHAAFSNCAVADVEMVPQEAQNGLPSNPYITARQQQPLQHHHRQQPQQPHHHQQIPAAAQAPPQNLQQLQHHNQQQQIPIAAQAPSHPLLQQQQQLPMHDGRFGAPLQYNPFVHNQYQAPQQQGNNVMSMHPQAVPITNEEAVPASGTAEYQMMYQNKLRGLQPYLGRLRDKLRQYHDEGAAEAADNVVIMINALEGRQNITWESLLSMESWILNNAEFQSF